MKIEQQHTYEKVILSLELIGFGAVIAMIWLDEYVDLVVADFEALEPNLDELLAFDSQPGANQHVRQRASIDRLEKTESEPIIHVVKSSDDLAREALLLEEPVRVCPRDSHPRKSALTLFAEPNQTNAPDIARLH